jgi:hypothetical protein
MLYAQYGRFKLSEAEESHIQAIDETFNLNLTGKLNANNCNVMLMFFSVQTQRPAAKRCPAKWL